MKRDSFLRSTRSKFMKIEKDDFRAYGRQNGRTQKAENYTLKLNLHSRVKENQNLSILFLKVHSIQTG